MKEKDTIKGDELERTNEEFLGTFDPGDEMLVGGKWDTITSHMTFSGSSYDHGADVDWSFEEVKPAN